MASKGLVHIRKVVAYFRKVSVVASFWGSLVPCVLVAHNKNMLLSIGVDFCLLLWRRVGRGCIQARLHPLVRFDHWGAHIFCCHWLVGMVVHGRLAFDRLILA